MNQKKARLIRLGNYYLFASTLSTAYLVYHFFNLKKNLQDPKNHEARIKHSQRVEMLANLQLPYFLMAPLLLAYSAVTGVEQKDLTKPLGSFKTLQEFFTREVKPRDFETDKNSLLAPADSLLLSIAKVEEDQVLSVKGSAYSICHFLTNDSTCKWSQGEIGSLKQNPATELYSLIFYLNPGDYHRFHSPADMTVTDFEHFKGDTQLVEPGNLLKNAVR